MKSLIFIIAIIFSTIKVATAQTPVIQWQKALGGAKEDKANCIQKTADGGYIVAGTSASIDGDVTGCHATNSSLETDYWITKLNSEGAIEWERTLGGTHDDVAKSIQQTSDGGYIVAGHSFSTNGDVLDGSNSGDLWVVKLNDTGGIQWQKMLGGTALDAANSIQQTSDGGYIVAGSSESNNGDVTGNHGGGGADCWVVKLNDTGIIQWQKSLGGTNFDYATDIKQTTDGGYIMAAVSYSNDGDVTGNHNSGECDYWVVKLSDTGAIQWQKMLGGTLSDGAKSIQQTADGGYVVAGYSMSNNGNVTANHGNFDYWVVKLSDIGAIQWQKSLGGTSDDFAQSIQQTSDSGYIVAGSSKSNNGDITSNHGDFDYWIVKLSSSGILQWQKSLGGTSEDKAQYIQQTSSNGYIVAGWSNSTNGDVTNSNGWIDYWVVKLDKTVVGTSELISQQPLCSIFPNPASQQLNVLVDAKLLGATYIIYDVMGKVVLVGTITTENTIIDLTNLAPSIYIFTTTDKSIYQQKFVKE